MAKVALVYAAKAVGNVASQAEIDAFCAKRGNRKRWYSLIIAFMMLRCLV
jgi:hypothetical protein